MKRGTTSSAGEKAGKRKAWTFEDAPSLHVSDLFADAEARRRFLREAPRELRDLLLILFLKMLPAGTVSNIGGFIGRTIIPRHYKTMFGRAEANFRRLRPEATDAEIADWLVEFADFQGRQRAEYAVMRRLAANTGNIRFVGTENLVETCAGQPVIFLGFHISNWEVAWQSLMTLGLPLAGSYDPPKRRAHHWLVNRERRRDGLTILKPGKDAVRPALQILKDNGNLIVFCDEGFGGKLRAPFFGRAPHLQGNYAFVARLARKTNALIYPIYTTRDHGTHFTLHAMEPFHLPPENEAGKSLVQDVLFLNAVVEPVVKRHLSQWYFIAHQITPIE